MRQLSSIQKIKSVSPIEGADAIEKLEVLGWELVAKKGDFKTGDFCVYIEIDSVLPERPEFEFMRSRKFKVKTVKMRGQISQGIAFPLSIITLVDPSFDINNPKEDQDVTELLGIVKWDPEQESLVEEKEPEFNDKNRVVRFYKKYRYIIGKKLGLIKNGATGKFPSYVPKTDETRVQTSYRGLATHQGKVAYITEKLEGASTTYIAIKIKGSFFKRLFVKQPMKFIVCSRNRIVNNKVDDRWRMAVKYDLEKKLTSYGKNIAIQGELIGPKVQGNIYDLPSKEFRMYLAYNIDEHRYFTFDELYSLANELQILAVPLLEDNHIVHTDVKSYVDLSIGNSKLNPKQKREGIVVRLKNENYSFKSINPQYLLENDKRDE